MMANEEQVALLKQGVDVWNQWRKENRGVKIDLSGADLEEVVLEGARLEEAKLENANLQGSNLAAAFLRESRLSHANLGEANLRRAKLNRTHLQKAQLDGADLVLAYLKRAILTQASLKEVKLNGANLYRANLQEADLYRADLLVANLQETELQGANLEGANLYRANLRGANLEGANLYRANLRGVNLTRANLRRANFQEANLYRARLREANLQAANLYRADLREANLQGTDLRESRLMDAQALSTNFKNSQWTGACIQNFDLNDDTLLIGAKCDYLYRSWSDKHEPVTFGARLPAQSDTSFKPGEFEQWIRSQAEAQPTMDLVFSEGIDWGAFAHSLDRLREQYPDAGMTLQTIENIGSAFVIRLNMIAGADQISIEAAQRQLYEAQLALNAAQGKIELLMDMSQILKRLASIQPEREQTKTPIVERPDPFWKTFERLKSRRVIILSLSLLLGAGSAYVIPQLLFPNGFDPTQINEVERVRKSN